MREHETDMESMARAAELVAERRRENADLIARARIGLRARAQLPDIPSQRELAQAIGVRPQSISEYLAGNPIGSDAREQLTALAQEVPRGTR